MTSKRMDAASSRIYFGTDGVRGRVGAAPLTADFALRLANAAARVLCPDGKGKVLIGKDTRLSGYMFESALEAGLVAQGLDVLLIGPLPTPGIAYMTRKLGCDFGIVISASHNKYDDNGIKFFSKDGGKIADELEHEIEAMLETPAVTRESAELGRATRADALRKEYQRFCAETLPKGVTLSGMKLVVDCANGAGYKVAPRVFADLGAEVIPIGTAPNGKNINEGSGSTAPELMQLMVKGTSAVAGIAFDGDGDRLIMCDHEGTLVDGDQILYILARQMKEAGTLKGPVVGTVMSNLGLEEAFASLGIEFVRAQVGDRYVLAQLKETGGVLGGEQSGHIVCLDRTTTGDGIISALAVLAALKESGKTLKELASGMTKFPQTLINVKTATKVDLAAPSISDAVRAAEKELGTSGRVLLRASGTEPVVRVMVEAKDATAAKREAERIAEAVRALV